MMGLQQVNKRKFHMEGYEGGASAAKTSRLSWPGEDSIAKLQAVAVPDEAWSYNNHHQSGNNRSVLVTSLLQRNLDEDTEEDDYEDELPFHQHHWNHCLAPMTAAPPQQQTIRCAENGKSYLELGAASANFVRPNSRQYYRERRLRMMNLSMCKLARFRQCPDPPLRRSVLICNTMRSIEREMEDEEHSSQNISSLPSWSNASADSGRSTPYPMTTAPLHQTIVPIHQPVTLVADCDSGYGDEESTRAIDWGSVLSLSALDPIVPSCEDDFADLLSSSWRMPSDLTDLDSPQRILVRS